MNCIVRWSNGAWREEMAISHEPPAKAVKPNGRLTQEKER